MIAKCNLISVNYIIENDLRDEALHMIDLLTLNSRSWQAIIDIRNRPAFSKEESDCLTQYS